MAWLALVLCGVAGAAFGQASAPPASDWLASPECGPARPGCKLSPAARRQVERQMRLEALRQEPAVPAGTGWSAPPQRYLPPPTPAEQIRPEHLERSTVKPEYRAAGERIPEGR